MPFSSVSIVEFEQVNVSFVDHCITEFINKNINRKCEDNHLQFSSVVAIKISLSRKNISNNFLSV